MTKPSYQAILADLDGTVNRGDSLIDGVEAVYKDLSERGIQWLFLSNNAGLLASDLVLRIGRFGISVSETQVINSASALIYALKREAPGKRVMVVGGPKLIQGIEDAGATISDDPANVDIVVAAIDKTFTYEKLKNAHIALQNGSLLWASNLDPTFPVAGGFHPGAGSIVAAITTAAGHPPDRVFGKPSPDMALLALDTLNLPASLCLVVGDRMTTDILFAKNAGMASALVLTGATARSDLAKYSYAPDYVFESIADVRELFD
ncbi:MAG: HAD-IIA family hydrolase [Desulfomonilaceae bacterium]